MNVFQPPGSAGLARKAVLASILLFLVVSGFMAILAVISGGFGDFELKVLLSTFVIAMSSICSLCCSSCFRRGRLLFLPGGCGLILTVFSALFLLFGIWMEMASAEFWKTAAILCVFAIAFAHALALSAVRLQAAFLWLQFVTAGNILALAGIISSMILEWDILEKGGIKSLAVLGILATLQTLAIPILGKLSKTGASPKKEVLSLTRRDDGAYQDKRGRLYQVYPMSR